MTALAFTPFRLSLPRLHVRRPADQTCVVRADFDRPDGSRWSAIGGGRNLGEALADAREGLPAGRWDLAGYASVYGE